MVFFKKKFTIEVYSSQKIEVVGYSLPDMGTKILYELNLNEVPKD